MVSDPRFSRIQTKARQGLQVWRGVSEAGPADPGDFGTGTYYSTSRARARQYGRLGSHRLQFANAIVLTVSAAYDLADDYQTLHGRQSDRETASLALNRDLRAAGHDGLIAVVVNPFGRTELEVVDLRLTEIR